MTNLHTITLALDDIAQLFQEPEVDLLTQDALYLPSIEYVFSELKPSSLRKRTHVNILMPSEKITPELQPQTQAAIVRYCQFRIHQNQNELSSQRWKGLKALQSGLLFLAACLLISVLIEKATFLPEFLSRFLSEGFVIVGWVSLWNPTEVLLYEWWPQWRENQILRHMALMDVSIQPKPAA